jgi:predicted nucleic acid-binding Zn ribbon protein
MESAKPTFEKLVAEQLRQAPATEAPMLAWPVAVGKTVAGITQAVGFADGILRVTFADTAWQASLREYAPKYIAGINALLGARAVTRIEYVADPNKNEAAFRSEMER